MNARNAKRWLALLLCMAMVLSLFTGCSGAQTPEATQAAEATTAQSETPSDTAAAPEEPVFPLPEKVTLSGFGCSYPGQVAWETMPLFEELEKRTNIHIDWEYMEQSPQTTERVNMMFASGDMPGIFIRAGQGATDRSTALKWGEAGLLIDMAPLIDQYAPNLKAMFEKYPAAKASNMTPDGKIYVLPTIYDYKPYQVWRVMQINTKWLERVGMEEPKTLDEFTEVLKAFRDQDANGNGDPSDEIPYSAHNFPICLRGILPGFGLNYAYDLPAKFEDGKFTSMATSDEFKAALEYCNMLYTEGLLDNEIFSQTNARYHGFMPDDRIGVMMLHQTLNAGPVAPDLKGMEPLIGPAGAENRVWSFYNPVVNNNCSAFITSNCEDPVAAIKWLDYLYSEEGSDLIWMGIEGTTYEENADGTLSYLDVVAKDPKGFSAAMGNYSIVWGNGSEPGCFSARQLEPGLSLTVVPENEKRVDPFLQDIATTPLPIMSADQEREYKELTQELNTYKNEMWAKFVTGDVGFDQWDTYCEQMEALGHSRLEAMIKEATGL